ncbi:MAG: hypothetical protein LBR98_00725 [Syntrophomonadaceae bacterium]|jgi:hypothetical protein|nr:hypothetical protein [Syntrophomonadaceae bacterium]
MGMGFEDFTIGQVAILGLVMILGALILYVAPLVGFAKREKIDEKYHNVFNKRRAAVFAFCVSAAGLFLASGLVMSFIADMLAKERGSTLLGLYQEDLDRTGVVIMILIIVVGFLLMFAIAVWLFKTTKCPAELQNGLAVNMFLSGSDVLMMVQAFVFPMLYGIILGIVGWVKDQEIRRKYAGIFGMPKAFFLTLSIYALPVGIYFLFSKSLDLTFFYGLAFIAGGIAGISNLWATYKKCPVDLKRNILIDLFVLGFSVMLRVFLIIGIISLAMSSRKKYYYYYD